METSLEVTVKTTSGKGRKPAAMTEANRKRSEALKERWAKKRELAKVAVTEQVPTPYTDGRLSLSDIHSVIDRCAAKGVLSFHYGQLQLIFKKSIDEPTVRDTRGNGSALQRVGGAGRVLEHQDLQENADLSAENLEHLKITDPAAYEAFIQSGDADDGGAQ